MISKYIQQFMNDNDIAVNERFSIKNKNNEQVLIEHEEFFKIIDVDNGVLEVVGRS